MAQEATHASNAAIHKIRTDKQYNYMKPLLAKWEKETPQGYGTCIVLDAINEEEIKAAVYLAEDVGGCAGVVKDPSYPLKDGKVTHFLDIVTCAYVFGDANDPNLNDIMRGYNLHK